MIIRDASEADLPSILEIYNDAVVNTDAIWNEKTVDIENRRKWLKSHADAGLPIIVAVDDDGILCGYASLSEWRPFEGYRHTVENSVYVNKHKRGKGTGRILMQELIKRASELNMHAIVAGIEAENAASIKLHEQLGFKTAGKLDEVGIKHGRWLDLVFMVLLLKNED
ncbi:MAG: N-acetyltransferase family protein [Deferribacterales bacterium]